MKAAISVDLDTLNDYAYTYTATYRKFPDPVYTKAVPRLLSFLKRHHVKATFFVIGRDLQHQKHLDVLKKITSEGHEIANHTYSHFHNFEKLSKKKREAEVFKCHQIVKKKLGITMKGFRAPGYNLGAETIDILSKNKYLYDSSIFPTIALPLFKMAIIYKSKGKHKSTGGGSLKNILAKDNPHLIKNFNLWEIPVAVTPFLRLPLMGTFNLAFGLVILKVSYYLAKKFSKPINYEIHPIDFLNFSKDDLPEFIKGHPVIKKPLEEKEKIYNFLITSMKRDYNIKPLKNWIQK